MIFIFFSPSENIFYNIAYKENYIISGEWPEDGISVSEKIFEEYTSVPPKGKIRGVSKDNLPCWVDAPPPTHEEHIEYAEAQRDKLIEQANYFMNSKQWPGKAAMARLTNDEKNQYNDWIDYLDALEAVDTSSAPNIHWPTTPKF